MIQLSLSSFIFAGMKQLVLFLLFGLLFFSCEKNVDFNLKYAAPVLVVDAQVENGQVPTVALNKSLDYFGAIIQTGFKFMNRNFFETAG